jgi:DNA-binding MarR family transcriptional regulator
MNPQPALDLAGLPRQSEAGAALTDLILLVFRVNGRLLQAADQMAEAGRLTAARWQVLRAVLGEARPVSEIARRMGLARQSVQALADALVADGFATWEPNPRHKRAKLLQPTSHAHTALRQVYRRQFRWSSAVGEEVGADRLRAAAETVEELLVVLQGPESDPPRWGANGGRKRTGGR